MATTDLEEQMVHLETHFSRRIAELEAEVSRLSQQVNHPLEVPETAWWKKIVGIYRDDPEFDEAMRLGREYRESLRPEEEGDSV